MNSCEAIRGLLLEYVFDVLDEGEKLTVQQHLVGCADCRAALSRTQEQQRLLAAAARIECGEVRFERPDVEAVKAVPTPRPAIVPMPHRNPMRWGQLAIAAAILVAVAVPGYVIGRALIEKSRAVNAVASAEARIAAEKKKVGEIIRERGEIEARRDRKVENVIQAQRDRQLKLVVTGTGAVQSGAPTDFQVQTRNFNDAPVDAEVWAFVSTQEGKEGQRIEAVPDIQRGGRKAGAFRLTLPADLKLLPGSKPNLTVFARRDAGPQTELSARLDLLGSAFVTHLATDKPMYQPGETVYFRSLTLDRRSLKPVEENLHLIYRISNSEVRDHVVAEGSTALKSVEEAGKKAVVVNGPDGQPIRGVGCGKLDLNLGSPGGEYVLSVEDADGRFPRQERRFIVNTYQKHVLQKQLDFNRRSYGAGDEVQALCKATGVNGPVKDAKVKATVLVDGKIYGADGKEGKEFALRTDEAGTVTVRFRLPAAIDKGQATLSVNFDDGKVNETLVRPVPIVLKKLQVEFFPEGGDLVAGLPNRVYFQVRTTLGKPADMRGRLLENGRPLDVSLQTLSDDVLPGVNQGMGRFEFTPKADCRYAVQVESPVGITEQYSLPAVKPDGVILSVPEGVVAAEKPIRVTVHSTKPRELKVGAYCRGLFLDSVDLAKGQTTAELKPASGDGGVCRITVFEIPPPNANVKELKPLAERLVYRQPAERLRVALKPDRSNYVPGQQARLTIEAFDEKDHPAAAVVMLAVVDRSVIAMADEKTARNMPTHFLLTTEVRRSEDLEYADFLLASRPLQVLGFTFGTDPRPAAALDLLLGTQGWRRFAEQNPTEFRRHHKDPGDAQEAERLLVYIGQSVPLTRDFAQEEVVKVLDDFRPEFESQANRLQQAEQAVTSAQNDDRYKSAVAALAAFQDSWDKLRGTLFPALTAALIVALLVCFFLALAREPKKALPLYLGMTACTVLVAFLFVNWRPRSDVEATAKDNKAPGWEMAKAAPAKAEAPGAGGGVGNGIGDGLPEDKKIDMAPAKADIAAMDVGGGNRIAEGKKAERMMMKGDGKEGAALGAFANQKGMALARAPQMQQLEQRGVRAANQIGNADAVAAAGKPAMPMAPMFRKRRGDFDGDRAFQEGLLRQADRREVPALIIREYAHKHMDKGIDAERSDATETIFWHPVLVLPDGKTEVSFALSEEVTRFEATAFAHTNGGRLGSATVVFDSKLPFSLYPKTPIEVTAGDTIALPVGIANNTGSARAVELKLTEYKGLKLMDGKPSDQFKVEGESARRSFVFRPDLKLGDAELAFAAKADGFRADAVRSKFHVVPEGFPRGGSFSDTLEGSAAHTIKLTEEWIPGTLNVNVQIYPSTMADLQKGLESLLREPGGCFEQTSTSSYPNVLILDYLDSNKQAKPEVERRARDLLGRGYQMLTSFECQNRKNGREGYEWFGGTAPPHEALTAYGLLQFKDMARFQEVDPAMIKRTQEYLLSRRDGKGGFLRNDLALDTFGRAPQHITDAYIVWAMTEAGCDETLKTELDALLAKAKNSKNPYFLSLVANGLINKGRTADAMTLLRKVADGQNADGHLDGLETSITSSRGRDLHVETTALAVLGWLKANPGEFVKPIGKAVKWIGQQRGGYGGFGSTQSTILALKALIAHTKLAPRETKGGELTLLVGAKVVASKTFKPGVSDTIFLDMPNPEQLLKQGDNKIEVKLTGNVLPFTLAWSYQTKKPAASADCPLKLETTLAKVAAKEGEVVRLTAKLKNTAPIGQGMALAVLGLPGGLTIPEDMMQLKEYTRIPEDGSRPLIGAFEIRGRELVLYWRDLAPGQEIEVPLDLVCRVPGDYTGPASRAYLYYNADSKCWIEPLHVTIKAAE